VVVAISVIFLYDQLKLAKNVATADFIMRVDESFNSEDMKKLRRRIGKLDFRNKEEVEDCLAILDFFEKVAYLEKNRVINLDAIDEMWGYWVERYWLLFKDRVYNYRLSRNCNLYYTLTEELFEKLTLCGIRKSKEADTKKEQKLNKEVEEYSKIIQEKELESFKREERELL
jgi:hypothetical protein